MCAGAASIRAWVAEPVAKERERWIKPLGPGEPLEKNQGLSHHPNSLIASLSVMCLFLDFCHPRALVLTVHCWLWCVPSNGPFTGVSS